MEFRPSLLPSVFLGEDYILQLLGIHDKNTKEIHEKVKLALIQTVINAALAALKSYEDWNLEDFDALIGNFGCQLNALAIFQIASDKNVKVQIEHLNKRITSVQKGVSKIKGILIDHYHKNTTPDKKVSESLFQFFHNGVNSIQVSQKVAYLMKARFLKIAQTCPDNAAEYIDYNQYNSLAKPGSTFVPVDILKNIVWNIQSDLSEYSIDILRDVALGLSLTHKASFRLQQILSIVRKATLRGETSPKSHVCQFYSLKIDLAYARENLIPVVVKELVNKKQTRRIASLFYQSASANEALARIQDADVTKLPQSAPCLVFEWDMNPKLNRDQLAARFNNYGLEDVILADTAQENQFEQGRTGLEHVIDVDAREEILHYARIGTRIHSIKRDKESFAFLLHVYSSSIGPELHPDVEVKRART